ncbi:MAG: D-glycero-beta-D-manno-heptose 1,7-bisphosphate 7-phosphatase [Gammaproteobacteria bacterium]
MTTKSNRRLIVLDRDGVINQESPDFIRRPEEWLPLPGSIEAIAELTRASFCVVVATNQSGVGRRLFSTDTLAAIHARMTRAIEVAGGRLDGIYVCPHRPEDACDCRKPLPGLLRQIEAHYGSSLAGTPVIGDSYRDLQAAWRVGARAVLVRTGNGGDTERRLRPDDVVDVFTDLAAAARQLIAEARDA